MDYRFKRWVGVGLGLLLPGILIGRSAHSLLPAEASPAVVRHITMDVSTPGGDSIVVAPVEEIRLYFSGEPLLRGASVRVVDSGRSLQRSTPPAADPDDLKQVFVNMTPALSAGAYVVQWRVIADDGHVMRGDFAFDVTAE